MAATASETGRPPPLAPAPADPASAEARATGRRPRRLRMTLRLRLTLLYGACFLVAGAVLLGVVYEIVANTTNPQAGLVLQAGKTAVAGLPVPTVPPGAVYINGKPVKGSVIVHNRPSSGQAAGVGPADLTRLREASGHQIKTVVARANIALKTQRHQQLATLLTVSGVALAVMALASIALGWLLAGRALRPLRTMNSRARAIDEDNLHERLGVEARSDELGELASTFDALLARLQRAFESQRQFVANASHELRTPVTLERALVEVALADPDASAESLRACCERVVATGEHQERLIDSLLALARSHAGVTTREAVDLRALTADLVAARDIPGTGIALETALQPATVSGDRALLERLVANLLDNAVAHNLPAHGWIHIETSVDHGRPLLRVANSGAAVPPERLEELFEPFRRLDGDRVARGNGVGLGLSIVQAIATAHGAALRTRPVDGGGLEVQVAFP